MPALSRITLARWVSIVAHPFVTVPVMVGASVAPGGGAGEAARMVGMVVLFTIVPIAVLMVLQVRRGSWENVDASNARERPVLFGVGVVSFLALLAYLLVVHPRSHMIRGVLFGLGMVVVCAVLTRWVKVSLHLAFGALSATILLLAGSPAGWVLALILPLLAWSRLVLKRHRAIELVLGTAVGIATGLAIRFG
jgi:membrane-associated phospholipid phosphatase